MHGRPDLPCWQFSLEKQASCHGTRTRERVSDACNNIQGKKCQLKIRIVHRTNENKNLNKSHQIRYVLTYCQAGNLNATNWISRHKLFIIILFRQLTSEQARRNYIDVLVDENIFHILQDYTFVVYASPHSTHFLTVCSQSILWHSCQCWVQYHFTCKQLREVNIARRTYICIYTVTCSHTLHWSYCNIPQLTLLFVQTFLFSPFQ